jgi:hypothetical protein
MIRRKRSPSDIAVPQNTYRHLQAGFAESNARRCVEYDRDRIFHPGDSFIDVLRWLWGGIDSPLTSGESLACTLLADHFAAVNAILAEQEPPPAVPMTIDEMITGLRVAGLESYTGPAEYQRICAMIRENVPAMTGYTAEGQLAHLMVPRQEPPAGKWDTSVPVTYSGKPREDQDDAGWLGQVTITEPGDSRRTFTHYPEHPDDPDHRALTWGYAGSGPLATGALILNDALGFGTPGTIDDAGVMPGGAPSPMLLAFTEDIVAKFPNQPGRASWQLSRSAVLEWVSRWRAENDTNGEASPET